MWFWRVSIFEREYEIVTWLLCKCHKRWMVQLLDTKLCVFLDIIDIQLMSCLDIQCIIDKEFDLVVSIDVYIVL